MAVNTVPIDSRLQLRLIVGQDEQGNPLYRTSSYSNVKPLVSDEAVYAVGTALAGLQKHTLEELRRTNNFILMEV